MTEDDGLGGLLRANRLRECIRACVDVLRAMSTPKFDSIRSQQIRSKLEDLAVLYRPLGIDLHSWLWEYYEQQARHSASEPHPRAVLESVTQQAGSLSQQDEDRERLMGTMFRMQNKKSKRRNLALEELPLLAQAQLLDYCDQILEQMESKIDEQQELLLRGGQLLPIAPTGAADYTGDGDDSRPVLLSESSKSARQPVGALLFDGSSRTQQFNPLIDNLYVVWDKPGFLSVPQSRPTVHAYLRDREISAVPGRAGKRLNRQCLRRMALVREYNESSGMVTQVRMCQTPFGLQLATAATTCASAAYNRPGNLHVLDVQRMHCNILADAHTVPSSRAFEDPINGAEIQLARHPISERELTGRGGGTGGGASGERFNATVSDVHFTADGRFLLSAGYDGGCTLWSAQTCKPIKTFFSVSTAKRGFVYNYGSCSGGDGSGELLNSTNGSDNNFINSSSSSGRRGGRGGRVAGRGGRRTGKPPKFEAAPRVHLLAPHRSHPTVFAAAQSDGSVWIWDWRSNVSTAAQQSLSFSCKSAGYGLKPAGSTTKRSNHSVECTTLAFGRRMSRHTLIYGQNNRQQETRPCVQFYDAIHQHHFEKYDDFDDSAGVEVSCLDVSTGGGQLVIGSCGDGELRVLDMRDCRQPSAVMCTQEMDMNAVAFSPCESLIAMCGSSSEVLVFDRRYFARPLHTLAHGPPLAIDPGCYTTGVSSVLWTSGVCGVEQLLLTGGSDGCVRVWDVAAGAAAPITCLSTDEGAVTSVCAVEEPTCSNSSSGAGSIPVAGDDCYWYLYGDGDDDREENNNTTAVDYLQRLTMAESGDDADAIGGGNIADSSSSIAFGLDTGRVYLYSLTSAALGGQS